MSAIADYQRGVVSILERIAAGRDSIHSAAQIIADAIADDKVIYVGHGGAHSGMILEETFYRAGGLACMNPMLDEAVFLGHGATRSTRMERTPGYGRTVVDLYGIAKDDVLLIITSVGITTMAIDEALEARERGARIIALTSTSFAENTPSDHPSRHPEGHNLHEIADLFLDCHVPLGDAVVAIDGVDEKVGPTSTVALAYLSHQLIAQVVAILHSRGITPPLWQSSNTTGGDEANRENIEKYRHRAKHLA